MDLSVVATIISVVCGVLTVCSFALGRKDKSIKDSKEEQKEFSKHDLIEYRLQKIEQNIEKILNKLDGYDKEIDERIKIALDNHIAIYHKGNK